MKNNRNKSLRKVLIALLAFICLFSNVPSIFALGKTENASTWEQVKTAISNAEDEVVINLTDDVTVDTVYTLNSGKKVTIISSTGKTLKLGAMVLVAESNELTLKDLEVQSTAANGRVVATTGVINVDGVSFTVAENISSQSLVTTGSSGTLNIFSGSFMGATNSINCGSGTVNIVPRGSITADVVHTGTKDCKVTPFEGTVVQIRFDGISDCITVTSPSVYTLSTSTNYSNFSITVLSNSTPTVTGTLTSDKQSYVVGDTVKVTAMLTPDEQVALSTGSMKFSYNKEKLEYKSALVNMTNLQSGEASGSGGEWR